MKAIKTILFCTLLYVTAYAQTNVNALNDTLTARYNREDFQGFYALGSAEWKKSNKTDGIIGWLNYMKSITGQVGHSAFSRSSHDTTYFTWDGQKKMISFLLKANGSAFDGFDFKDYHIPPSAVAWQSIPTDNPLRTPLDSAVQTATIDFMLTHKLMGVSIGLVKDGKKYSYNYGTIEKGKSSLPTSHTTFELASVTKTFTGILLAQAVLDKKINLTDDIRKYIDGDYPNLQYKGNPIRIVNLSNHTSGLPAELPNLDQYKSSFEVMKMYDHYTDDKFFSDLRQVKIDTLPGTTYGYSNSGVKLLGILLEKVYGKSYNGLLQQYICAPMKMKNTRTALAVSDTTSYTKGYDGLGKPMPHLNFNMFGGAGSILSTTQDMMNYVAQNITEKLPVVKLSHQQTFENADGALGFCWQINKKTVNGTRIWKSGGALGFRSYCAVVPDKRIGIIWLSNRSDLMEDDLSDMVDKLLQAALKKK
jgi:D-alanyl-D-alanine-carboxypeptidase/D-alanyl-D-alanine-endopeptidase